MPCFIPMILFVLHAALAVADGIAPGGSDSMCHKRASRDLGIWTPDCKGREAACNNACFYNRCLAKNTVDADKTTFNGPDTDKEKDRNRHELGCRVDAPWKPSVCGAFPFSQRFSDKLARDWECDAWPPASAQQSAFDSPGRIPNSLRCMTLGENKGLGSALGVFLASQKALRDDFFRVDFTTNIASADPGKVKYCLPQADCTQDVASPYDLLGRDNTYKRSNTGFNELFQCSVKFNRVGDASIIDAKVSDWQDTETRIADFKLPNDNAKFNIQRGLPMLLEITRTGPLGTELEFSYAPGVNPGWNINHFD